MRHIGNVQVSGSFKQQGSDDNVFAGDLKIASGALITKGGSTQFGDDQDDSHTLTGVTFMNGRSEFFKNTNYTLTGSYIDGLNTSYGSANGLQIFGESISLGVGGFAGSGGTTVLGIYETSGDYIIDFSAADIYYLGGSESSLRFKKNVENISQLQMDKFESIRPVEFDYIKNDKHSFGFIAEEIETLYPENVIYKDGQVWGIEYSNFIPILVKEIQNLRQRVAQLESGSL
jgi:hypothetical protein